MSEIILLFPGYQNSAAEWSEIVEYKHPQRGKRISFLRKLKETKRAIHFVDVDWSKKVDISKFNKELRTKFEKTASFILIGHSIASIFIHDFVSSFKKCVKKILLLDTTLIGPEGKSKVDAYLADNSGTADEVRKDLARQTPIAPIVWPVPTVQYRNIHMREDGSANIKKENGGKRYRIRYYVNIGHFVQTDNQVVSDILADLAA